MVPWKVSWLPITQSSFVHSAIYEIPMGIKSLTAKSNLTEAGVFQVPRDRDNEVIHIFITINELPILGYVKLRARQKLVVVFLPRMELMERHHVNEKRQGNTAASLALPPPYIYSCIKWTYIACPQNKHFETIATTLNTHLSYLFLACPQHRHNTSIKYHIESKDKQ